MTIRYLFASDLDRHEALAASMFRDRAAQVRDRMGWPVRVDALGWETDRYDALDPLYVAAEDAEGRHEGSMRFLPTTGPHMLAEVFPHLVGGRPVRGVGLWECTRFCLAPGAGRATARRLLLAASELGLGLGWTRAVGIFDAPMARVYRRLGWEPVLLGARDGIAAGLWTFSDEAHDRLCDRAGVPAAQSRRWFERDLGPLAPLPVGG
jgi:acyl homoserine lactone synthase